jgi:hypothetical protein
MKLQKNLIAVAVAAFALSFMVGDAEAKRKDHHWYDHKHKHHRYCDHGDHYRGRDDYRYRSHDYRRVYIPRHDVVFFDGYPYHRPSRERLTVIYDGRGFVLGYTFRNDYDDRRYRSYYGDRYSYRF